MGTLSGIDYDEMPGSNVLQYSPDGIVGTRQFQVDWDDRIEFCELLLGYTNAVGHVPIRTEAQRFPDYTRLYCRYAVTEGVGELNAAGEVARYELARVRAEYRPWSYGSSNVEDDEYDEDLEANMERWEESHEYGVEMYSVSGSDLYWSDDPLVAIGSPMGVLIGIVDYTFTSNAEPELLRDVIRATRGRINDDTWMGAPAGYMLFLGASARRTATSQGVNAWAITYRFRERTALWNAVLDGDTWRLVEGPFGERPYRSANFSALFIA